MDLILPKGRLTKLNLRTLKAMIIDLLSTGEPKGYSVFLTRKGGTLLVASELAETDLNVKHIYMSLDQPISEVVTTYIHEFLHVAFPMMPERKIERLARRVVEEMTQGDKEFVFKAFAKKVIWDE